MCALVSEVTNGSVEQPEVAEWATTNRHRKECVAVGKGIIQHALLSGLGDACDIEYPVFHVIPHTL